MTFEQHNDRVRIEYKLVESRILRLREDLDRIHTNLDQVWITMDRVLSALDILRVCMYDADAQAELEMMSKDEFERMLTDMLGDDTKGDQ